MGSGRRARAGRAALAVLAVSLFLLATGCEDREHRTLALEHARIADPPWAIEPFDLVDHTGAPFSRRDLKGHWTVLFSGFTHCPDVCPATLAILRTAQQGLEHPDRFRTVFVSVDPERDTPASLAEYVTWFDESWIGVTGDREELDRLLGSLQMAYVRVPTSRGAYTMDHATAVALIDSQGRMVGWWAAPLDATEVAADLNGLPRP